MKRIAGPLVLAVIVLADCGSSSGGGTITSSSTGVTSPSPSPESVLTGTLELTTDSTGLLVTGSVCTGTGGYSDISTGTSVTLTNENGTVIGTTSLQGGTAKNPGDAQVTCVFKFAFDSKPKAKFYSVEVSHRGKITESASELEGNGDAFGVTLGS